MSDVASSLARLAQIQAGPWPDPSGIAVPSAASIAVAREIIQRPDLITQPMTCPTYSGGLALEWFTASEPWFDVLDDGTLRRRCVDDEDAVRSIDDVVAAVRDATERGP